MKKLSLILAVLMLVVAFGCTGTPETPQVDPTAVPTDAPAPTAEPTAEPEAVKEPAVYNSVEGFHLEADAESVWQYYFSIDDGATVTDPCEDNTDYGTYGGWHPWEGAYTGVGFNHDVEGYLEFNTDMKGGIMGVLVFVAPSTGKYVVTAQVFNPWKQNLDKFTVKTDAGVVVEREMSDVVDVYGFITPTDVELNEGDRLYFMCNSQDESWASCYSNITLYYEPQDDSVYVVPEVEVPVKEVLGVDPNFEQEAKWSAYRDFDRTAADGSNVPWVYAQTVAWGEFATMQFCADRDWGATEWYLEDLANDYVGVGISNDPAYRENYLEMNTEDYGLRVACLGFKAPAAGTYAFNGYVQNVWGQNLGMLRVYKGAEYYKDFAAKDYTEKPNEFAFDATLEEGEIVWFFVDSESGWTSAGLAVYVNEAEPAPAAEVNLQQDAQWAAYRDFDRTAADGSNVPWVYAQTVAWGEFATMQFCADRDWGATEWYLEDPANDYVGVGISNAEDYRGGYLEMNTEDYGLRVACLGFKAPAAGTYAFNGYVQNVWGQALNMLRVYKNADNFLDFAISQDSEVAVPFEFEVELNEGDIVWFFADSNGGWTSAGLAVFVNAK